VTATMTAAAWVDGAVITVDEVDARVAALRRAAFGSRLPGPHTAEGRNARRWVVQLLCAERVVRSALADLGRVAAEPTRPVQLGRALRLGGVAAAVLATIPDSTEVISRIEVDETAVRSYYDRNRDLFADRGVPYATARPGIAEMMRADAADRAFGAWLEGRMSATVVLAPGFEHPAEPGHADSTHRH
jgi:[acyl-carrier-protein] S-malonyltransferase